MWPQQITKAQTKIRTLFGSSNSFESSLKAASCKALLVLPFSPFPACDQCSGVMQKFFLLYVAIHNMVYYPGMILREYF